MGLNGEADGLELVELIKSDLHTVQLLMTYSKYKRDSDVAVYHLQQAVEKCLKLVIYSQTESSIKSHDIQFLIRNVTKLGLKVPNGIKNIANKLTMAEAEARYKERQFVNMYYINMVYPIVLDYFNKIV